MFYRPWPIVVIAVFHILAPIFNLLLSASLVDLEISQYLALQMRKDPTFLPLWLILPVGCGVALLTFQKWSYYLFLSFMAMVVLYTLRQRLLFPHRVDFATFMALQFVNLSVIAYFLSQSARTVYLNKKIRWWQQKPRYVHSTAAQILQGDSSVPGVIQNISEGGLYVTTSIPLKPKDPIHIRFEMFGQKLELKGLVVHVENQSAGVLFQLDRTQQKSVQALCRKLKAENVPVRGRELTTFESFKAWAKDLFRSGTGLFPNLK